MKNARAIFRFLRAAAERGERHVLVTLTDVVGSSSRSPGTHMAVSESGAFSGSLSGGCVEAAVVAEALAVLKRGRAALVRFGAGSRYIDIRLPCGGGIDLLFTPDPPKEVIAKALARLEARSSVTLALEQNGRCDIVQEAATGWTDYAFQVTHQPDLQLVVVGHGAEAVSLARLGIAHGTDVRVLSPDPATLVSARSFTQDTVHLPTPASTQAMTADEHSAIVFLFHDHDWEPLLMAAALATPAFFVGAMGSRRTHAQRLAVLREHGLPSGDAARIVGPIGLIPAARDPDTLALSVLAQIVATDAERRAHDYIRQNTV